MLSHSINFQVFSAFQWSGKYQENGRDDNQSKVIQCWVHQCLQKIGTDSGFNRGWSSVPYETEFVSLSSWCSNYAKKFTLFVTETDHGIF